MVPHLLDKVGAARHCVVEQCSDIAFFMPNSTCAEGLADFHGCSISVSLLCIFGPQQVAFKNWQKFVYTELNLGEIPDCIDFYALTRTFSIVEARLLNCVDVEFSLSQFHGSIM